MNKKRLQELAGITEAADVGVLDPATKDDIETKKPSMYNVILINDDYSHAHVVADILAKHFNKRGNVAFSIMVKAHKDGEALVGIYTKDVAETKVKNAEADAQSGGHPLHFRVEKNR